MSVLLCEWPVVFPLNVASRQDFLFPLFQLAAKKEDDDDEEGDDDAADPEELSRSYCRLVVTPLVKQKQTPSRQQQPPGRYVPCGDLARPVRDFKVFRKQVGGISSGKFELVG